MHKFSKVLLFDKKNNHTQEFTVEHAEKILRHDKDWNLVENSPYTFSKENGIRVKSDPGVTKEPIKEKSNRKSGKTSK